jgi:CRISPR/Cas system-associated protein Cas5 (RAMP superfamily)
MEEYFKALRRLENGKPTIVAVGTKISNDAVSLEAGKKKGSIKKSRSQFETLITRIDEAAAKQKEPERAGEEELTELKKEAKILRDQLDESKERELSLLWEIHRLKCKLHETTGENVVPLRSHKEKTNL